MFEEHLKRVEQEQLVEHGLKLKPHKYHLFRESIEYLAHIVFREGVQPIDLEI